MATKIFFAPMAGVGDSAFRTICMRHGCDGVTSEMISAKATVFGDKKTMELARRTNEEVPFSLQIFGSEPDIMAKGGKILADASKPDFIDINMGCPVNKIVKNSEGSALMKSPSLVYEIVSRVTEAVYPIPVSVKIRLGFDTEHINAVEVALMAEKGGAKRVTVHGRTRSQLYAPPVNLDVIREVKEALKCEVIGNGDIKDPESAKHMLDVTGCDHLMIGRGALGSPWIFREIKAALSGEEIPKRPVGQELYDEIVSHLDLAVSLKSERQAIMESRAQIAWYVKNMKGAAKIRQKINYAATKEEVKEILKDII
ncbi:MAG: tRNA dihydrouridine synthase DusB [Ruminococcaceae bacterium]|nr:tRNA dihydrouridine synthase DusB [Oscillospiraceae bacterium]